MKSSLLTRRRRRPEINIIPLIDICVKLIFFFLVSMQFRDQSAASTLNLTLPQVETAGKSTFKNHLLIAISKDKSIRLSVLNAAGSVVFDRTLASAESIKTVAAELRSIDKNTTVLIRSDETVPLKLITETMDLCRKEGLNKIRLQTR